MNHNAVFAPMVGMVQVLVTLLNYVVKNQVMDIDVLKVVKKVDANGNQGVYLVLDACKNIYTMFLCECVLLVCLQKNNF